MGIIGNALATVLNDGAAEVVESALVAGAVTAVSLLLNDITHIVKTDLMGGIGIFAATVVLKAVQKGLAQWQAKKSA